MYGTIRGNELEKRGKVQCALVRDTSRRGLAF
jgi:hypothetical protein